MTTDDILSRINSGDFNILDIEVIGTDQVKVSLAKRGSETVRFKARTEDCKIVEILEVLE